MFMRHRYQSPQTLLTNPGQEREARQALSPDLARYSSAKLFERASLTNKQLQSALRKRIELYTYNLSDLIGEGYTSRVFKAAKDNTSESFAIKVVDLRKYTATNRQMLESEVSILKQLNHPNVIRCYDVFVTSNNCYIVTEYCEGGDLMALLKKHKKTEPMGQARTTAIIKDVLSGYKYLAEHGIVHRDLKPANIFFRNGIAKIADFGFAKKLQLMKQKQNYNVGTPLYMPPEALVYSRYSLQSDIFSIGVLIYEILYGHAPWESRSQKQLIVKMTKNPLNFPHQIQKNLKDMIRGCLAIDIASRFTVDQLFSCQYVQALFGNPQENEMAMSTRPRKSQNSTKSTTHDSQSKQDYYPSSSPYYPPVSSQHPCPYFYPSSPAGSLQAQSQTPSCSPVIKKKLHLDRNTSLILVQLNYCRFMYYLSRNRIPVMKSTDKDKLNCILQRHILKVIEKLAALTKCNSFNLPDYEDYVLTSAFGKIKQTIGEYHQRYRNQFAAIRAKQSSKYLRLVQQDLENIQEYDHSGDDIMFYQEVQEKVREITKGLILAIDYELVRTEEDRRSLAPSFQGLRSMLKYLTLLRLSTKFFEDYEHFMMFSSISVLTDYNKSSATVDDYAKLKTINV